MFLILSDDFGELLPTCDNNTTDKHNSHRTSEHTIRALTFSDNSPNLFFQVECISCRASTGTEINKHDKDYFGEPKHE